MAEKHSLDSLSQSSPENMQSGQGDMQWFSSTDPKRRKVDHQVAKSSIDPHNAPVSRVVHGRAIPDGCTFQMIVNTLQRFGKITYITMMPRLRQALVEFERPDDALNCVRTTAQSQIYVLERPIFFNFSTSQEITRSPYGYAPDANQPPPVEPGQNHILLLTIFNPSLPINVQVLHTINSPYGAVQRIAIFRKNGVQALVEFDNNASAANAKRSLEGADIYAGCCTLKTEYARTQRVNVYKNDDMTWDFTIQGQQRIRPQVGLQQTPMGFQQQGFQQGFQNFQQPHQMATAQPGSEHPQFGAPHVPTAVPVPGMQFPPPGSVPGSVVMVYGLNNQKMNCDLLFNLFCSYGNLLKVKFLLNKPGTAMVHMDNAQSAKNAIQYLTKSKLFGSELELAVSKHDFIADHGSAGLMPDGSACWKDFSRSRNNRFVTAKGTSKNRVIGPTNVLHFYNAPPDAKEDTLRTVFAQTTAVPPSQIKFFSQGDKSATGLMQWPNVEVALDSFVLANHYTIQHGDARAYTFKLAFSPAPSVD